MATDPICPLCDRPIPAGVPASRHHLVPRLKGGKGGETVLLHHICHRQIHATLTEAELARSHASIEALRQHPRIAAFVAWVARRPPGFTSRVPGPRRRR
ncbi:MAG: HNH endonuclease [Rhodobacteraceae bacterium]|nr:HNH endonuclease [Paracoccaceae bacterium]